MKAKAQLLLDRVRQMENAARRGIELNNNRVPGIPPEKTVSLQQCQSTLKDCEMFRRWINDIFELQQ